MRFEYHLVQDWPPLAWLAKIWRPDDIVEVWHGERVEVKRGWFCEAVWAGDFESGDFDLTDLVFGSGARIRDGKLTFVSSGSLSDRLQSLECGGAHWVSNSLVCVLAAVGGELDPTYTGYTQRFQSLFRGFGAYDREIMTSVGPARLTYFENLVWTGTGLVEAEKPNPVREFVCFESYHSFLDRSLRDVSRNMTAPGRRHPYEMLGTISSGYDSPTVSVLARRHGLREVVTFDQTRGRETTGELGYEEPDSGLRIAEILGLEALPFSWRAWQAGTLPEVPFLAVYGNAKDVWFAAVDKHLQGRVLLTGCYGDKVWNKYARNLDTGPVPGGLSGLSLSEYRLWSGFIHWPIPFMGAREIRRIGAISRSSEMEPWDIPGSYNRPICRRIVEEAGVPRELLGQSKRHGALRLSERSMFRSTELADDLAGWLGERRRLWLAKRRLPPQWISKAAGLLQPMAVSGARAMARISGRTVQTSATLRRLHRVGIHEYLYKFVFPWAVEKAKERYSNPSPIGSFHRQTSS